MGKKTINGITLPYFGMSWDVEDDEIDYALRLIDFLEGKRVLFNKCDMGCKRCTDFTDKSILDIKSFLTNMIMNVKKENEFKVCLRKMRQICNMTLNDLEETRNYLVYYQTCTEKKCLVCPIVEFRIRIAKYLIYTMDMYDIREVGMLNDLILNYRC